MKHGTLTYNEVNTGGGCMVNIITSTEWDYILVANEDCVTAYANEDAFWDGEDCLDYASTKQLPRGARQMSRRAKRPKVWTMIAEECEQRGMKVLYVNSDSTYVQGLSYDLIIIDEFVDVAKEQQNNG